MSNKDDRSGELSVDSFLDELETFVAFQVDNVDLSRLKVTIHPCDCGGRYVRRKNEKGTFWGCNNYPECRNAVPDRNGQPDFTAMNFDANCPRCKAKMKYHPKACNCTNEACKFVLWERNSVKHLRSPKFPTCFQRENARNKGVQINQDWQKYDAALQLQSDGSVSLMFNNKRK